MSDSAASILHFMGAMAGAGFALYGGDQVCKAGGNEAALDACKKQAPKTTPGKGKGAKPVVQSAAQRDAACTVKFPSKGGFAASSIGKILFKYGSFIIILAFFMLSWYMNNF